MADDEEQKTSSEPAATDEERQKDEHTHLNSSKDADAVHHGDASESKLQDKKKVHQSEKQHLFSCLWSHVWARILLPIAVLVLVSGVLIAIPSTRYAIGGLLIKRDVTVTIQDQATHKPVSTATVYLAGLSAQSDAQGVVRFKHVPAGNYTLSISKKYYKDNTATVLVPILSTPHLQSVNLQATGRQVPVTVVNKITGRPIGKASVNADGSTALTDQNGEAVIVLPANKQSVEGTVRLAGFNTASITIDVTDQKSDKNSFAVVPNGMIYFLSNRTGTINVMKAQLDGSNAAVVLQGTGKEDTNGTTLLASRDWRYLILEARRDSDQAKIYLIDTTTDKLSVVDEGNVAFNLVGWYGHQFIYTLTRNGMDVWQPNRQAMKIFNADTTALNTVDQNAAEGSSNSYDYETIESSPYILQNQIVYVKGWSFWGGNGGGKAITINVLKLDTLQKTVIKQFPFDASSLVGTNSYYSDARLYTPQEIRYLFYLKDQPTFFEYANGQVADLRDLTRQDFYTANYPTYLISPSGSKTFWFESRDGKNSLFVGNSSSDHGQSVGALQDYTPYGWFTDDYVLLSKNSSELYIAPASGPITDQNLLKLTDYYKPPINFYGYGYGYGGL